MPRPLLAALLSASLSLAGCTFGLHYSGHDGDLLRETVVSDLNDEHVLSYLRAGDPSRQRVIFVHGSPGRSNSYADYVRELSRDAEVVAVDRLGYGASSGSGTVVSFREQAAAIEPLLVESDGRWPVVVGHSLGGPIAARLAADHPERVGALVIVAGGLDPELEKPRWYNEVARWWIVHPLLAGFLKVSNREMWAAPEEVEELDPLLERITCPVYVIHGTGDSLVPFETIGHSIERFSDNEHVYVAVLIGEEHRITKMRRDELVDVLGHVLAGGVDYLDPQQ